MRPERVTYRWSPWLKVVYPYTMHADEKIEYRIEYNADDGTEVSYIRWRKVRMPKEKKVKHAPQRILIVCQGGNVRSVHVAYVLKYYYKLDALSASWERNSIATLRMLMRWADVIMIVEQEHLQYVPQEFHRKTSLIPLGPDQWGIRYQDLVQTVCDLLQNTLPIMGSTSNWYQAECRS